MSAEQYNEALLKTYNHRYDEYNAFNKRFKTFRAGLIVCIVLLIMFIILTAIYNETWAIFGILGSLFGAIAFGFLMSDNGRKENEFREKMNKAESLIPN